METNTIEGTYGSGKTPCLIYTATLRSGDTWYAVEGSSNVNLTPEVIEPGTDVEELNDIDGFTWPKGIHGEEDLVAAVEA